MRYVISCGLLTPDKDYQQLTDALGGIRATHIMPTQWVASRNGTSPARLRDWVRQYVDEHDRVLVTELDGAGWAGCNLEASLPPRPAAAENCRL